MRRLGDRHDALAEAVRVTEEAEHAGEVDDRETTANALYNHLYEACNILRGPIDQDDYKSYVIPILFFKRISDVYDEETADAEQQYGDDIEFYPEEELHTFIIPITTRIKSPGASAPGDFSVCGKYHSKKRRSPAGDRRRFFTRRST